MLKYMSQTHTTKKCLGTRDVLSEEDELQENGRVFKKYKMGDYQWRNFTEVELEALHFGNGLRKLGIRPKDNVVIFSETRAEWMIAAHGLFKHSCTIVTIYATLGEEGIIHGKRWREEKTSTLISSYKKHLLTLLRAFFIIGVNETEVSVVITSHELMPKLKAVLDKIPKVKTIVYFEDQLHKTDLKGFEKIQTIAYKEVIENGINNKIEPVPPSKNDVAIIMYTSGSTGHPKGVLLTHNNCISTLKCFCDCVSF